MTLWVPARTQCCMALQRCLGPVAALSCSVWWKADRDISAAAASSEAKERKEPKQKANGFLAKAQRLLEPDQRQDETSRAGPELKSSFSRRSQQVRQSPLRHRS